MGDHGLAEARNEARAMLSARGPGTRVFRENLTVMLATDLPARAVAVADEKTLRRTDRRPSCRPRAALRRSLRGRPGFAWGPVSG